MPKAAHLVYGVSLVLHLGLGAALAAIHVPKKPEPVTIELRTIERPKPPKPPEPEPEPEQAPTPHRAAPPPKAAAPAEAAPPPDFGFAMAGAGSAGGLAIPTGPKPEAAVRQTARKLVAAPKAAEAGCSEDEVKAHAISMPHPAYTDDARAAAIEGKVRVQLTVGADGAVTDAVVLEGLGHGLDEAAVASLREGKFSPATRCGVPVAATFVVAVRFAL